MLDKNEEIKHWMRESIRKIYVDSIYWEMNIASNKLCGWAVMRFEPHFFGRVWHHFRWTPIWYPFYNCFEGIHANIINVSVVKSEPLFCCLLLFWATGSLTTSKLSLDYYLNTQGIHCVVVFGGNITTSTYTTNTRVVWVLSTALQNHNFESKQNNLWFPTENAINFLPSNQSKFKWQEGQTLTNISR